MIKPKKTGNRCMAQSLLCQHYEAQRIQHLRGGEQGGTKKDYAVVKETHRFQNSKLA
jgi:hypothetical protein